MAVSQAAGRWVRGDSAEAVKVAMGKVGEDAGWQAILEAGKWVKVGVKDAEATMDKAGEDAGWQAILEAGKWAKGEAKDAEAAMAVSQVAVKGAEVGAIPRSG